MDPDRGFVKQNVRFGVVRRHFSLAVASAILALAVAGFLSGARPAAQLHGVERAIASPLVELQAVPAGAPRVEARTAIELTAAALTWAFALAAAAVGYVARERRRRPVEAVPVWSASLRGPPRLAAL